MRQILKGSNCQAKPQGIEIEKQGFTKIKFKNMKQSALLYAYANHRGEPAEIYFHRFSTKLVGQDDGTDREQVVAVIEHADGKIDLVEPTRVQLINVTQQGAVQEF
jgi:hypothetical protein